MDASESPPNSSDRHHQRNHCHHPHPRSTHAVAPYQTNPNIDTTNALNTPDSTPSSITHLRRFATVPNRHRQHVTTHHSVRRVSSSDTSGLGGRNSLAETLSPVQLQLLQHQQQEQAIATVTPLPLFPTTTMSPVSASTRFNFAVFWNPQRLFSAVRPASTPPPPLSSPSASPSATSPTPSPTPSPPSSSGTVTRMVTSGGTDGDISTPTPSTISKSSSSSSMLSLAAQGEFLNQDHRGGPRRSSLSVKPVSASTAVAASPPPNSDPGLFTSSTFGRQCHHQDMSPTRSQQFLASVPGGFNALSISRNGGNSSDLESRNSSIRTHKSGSGSSGSDSSPCYPSPTSPDSSSTEATEALEQVQKLIAQGQAQLVQYTKMIHKHETDQTGYVTLQGSQQKRREVLEKEIEVLENAIRQGPSTPVSPLSMFFSSANPIFGQGGSIGFTSGHAVTRKSPPAFFSWSSPPFSYEADQDYYQGQDTPCCPFNAASTRANAPTSSSASTPIATTPITATTSNVAPTTAFPRRSSTSTISIPYNQSSSPLSPSDPFVPSGPTRSRSTSSLRVTFSAPESSSFLSSPSKSYDSCFQLQSIPSPQPLLLPPLPPPPTLSTSSPAAAAVPLQMCHRCSRKSTLTERRDQLRNVQRSIDQVQQKIHSTNSQIRHLQRTFVLPIETGLQEDQEELERLLQLQMLRSQSERQQQQHQQQQNGGGGRGRSRLSSGSSSGEISGDGTTNTRAFAQKQKPI